VPTQGQSFGRLHKIGAGLEWENGRLWNLCVVELDP